MRVSEEKAAKLEAENPGGDDVISDLLADRREMLARLLAMTAARDAWRTYGRCKVGHNRSEDTTNRAAAEAADFAVDGDCPVALKFCKSEPQS